MPLGKIICSAVAAAAAGGYCFIENRQLKVTKYTVTFDNLPCGFSGKRILHISDLHTKLYGDRYDNLINPCTVTKPDYIFFTGDLYSRKEKNVDHKAVLMERLMELAPVYYIYGNHEANTREKADALACKLEKLGVHVLRNQKARLYVGDEFVNVYGADIDELYYKNPDGSYKNLPGLSETRLDDMLGIPNKNEFNILLAHTPFPFKQYAQWGADLTFSGHCHGGVIRLPVVGGLLSPERKFFPEYTKGIYTLQNNGKTAKMEVSAGLGKFRMWNPSEIVVVTLKKSEGND